jgi:hypothetical protein
MEEQLTPEQVQNHIRAAFDSVGLINDVVAGTQMQNASIEDKKNAIQRNIGHLNIMLGKEWFVEGLTEQQATDINDCITAGNTYIAEN